MLPSMKQAYRGNHMLTAKLWITLLALLMVVFGCGGGGSSGSPAAGNNISYTGNTQPAAIDTDNAQRVAAVSYKGGQTGETMNPITTLQAASGTNGPGRPLSMNLFEMFEDNLIQSDIASPIAYGAAAVVNESDTIYDECDGSGYARYTVTANDQTGEFSGSFTYHDFCSEEGTYSGSAAFSGVINTSGSGSDLFTRFTIIFTNLTATSEGVEFTMSGELEFAGNSGNPTVTLDLLVHNTTTDEVAWIKDYTLAYDGQTVDISGTYYDYEHGKVTIETESSFYFGHGEEYPSSGVMIITGADGSAGGSTKVRVEAISSTTCRVTADTDGDGAYDDYDSGNIAWTELDDE